MSSISAASHLLTSSGASSRRNQTHLRSGEGRITKTDHRQSHKGPLHNAATRLSLAAPPTKTQGDFRCETIVDMYWI
ncbi:predicted protein [Arabidopsis lyrata subsp. lyrata]|uniref:Predicted protein n=1 Tax=Arabidopsis lyrata subsp. lyrata TaxID=81972 RepID=D7LU12_ARALL|nr:predicted protein [Arabidopsis lyrata subsp. lyrata]